MGLINKIEVVPMKSEYCDYEHHTIVVDDTPLDVLLHSHYPSNNLLGMIPTIIDWLNDPKEKELITERYNSVSKDIVLPVLICPDDCDMCCTVNLPAKRSIYGTMSMITFFIGMFRKDTGVFLSLVKRKEGQARVILITSIHLWPNRFASSLIRYMKCSMSGTGMISDTLCR